MTTTYVGEVRPSQVLFGSGIGSICDLPNFAAIVQGLDDWDYARCPVINEERLLKIVQSRIGQQVQYLRLPPQPTQNPTTPWASDLASKTIGIPLTPFPTWMVCSRCRMLKQIDGTTFVLKSHPYRPENTYVFHYNCQGNKPPRCIPVRFLVACENGHLDEFPWEYFVHSGNSHCKRKLTLQEYGVSGAAVDIEVRCECGARRRLSDAIGFAGRQNMPQCRGHHPHLNAFNPCSNQARTLAVGASNTWFPLLATVLSLPAQGDRLERLIEEHWSDLQATTSEQMLSMIFLMPTVQQKMPELIRGYTLKEVWNTIQKRRNVSLSKAPQASEDIKRPEWNILTDPNPTLRDEDFLKEHLPPPAGFESLIVEIVKLHRLREVSALTGFTRIDSPGDLSDVDRLPPERKGPLSTTPPRWVPAAESRGEGIFIRFNEVAIQAWLARPAIQDFAEKDEAAYQEWCIKRTIQPDHYPGARYGLLHSFSHALMRRLSLACGYNAASLRERIYSDHASDGLPPMAGVLIYTAASDSEGTLGGLVNLGEPEVLGNYIQSALVDMFFCASDPLCAEHYPQQSTTGIHWAACHTCLFSPETSCEAGNRFLDRSLLVPTLGQSEGERAFFNTQF